MTLNWLSIDWVKLSLSYYVWDTEDIFYSYVGSKMSWGIKLSVIYGTLFLFTLDSSILRMLHITLTLYDESFIS